MIHLYLGNGKGKTSSAVGLGVRAAGRGLRVLMLQFLKCTPSGEVLFLADCKNFTIKLFESQHNFVKSPLDKENATLKSEITAAFEYAKNALSKNEYDVLILDEVLDAAELGFISEASLISLLGIGYTKEIVLTGRRASEELIKIADYVSEFVLKKHPYQRGINAREGIEF